MRMTDNQLQDLYMKGARYNPIAKCVLLGGTRLNLSPSSVARFRNIQTEAESAAARTLIRRNSMGVV